jgi:hypothetical protein
MHIRSHTHMHTHMEMYPRMHSHPQMHIHPNVYTHPLIHMQLHTYMHRHVIPGCALGQPASSRFGHHDSGSFAPKPDAARGGLDHQRRN